MSDATKGKLIKAEERETGHVNTQVYKEWIKGAGGLSFFAPVVVLYLLGEACRVGSSFWLGIWAADKLKESAAFYMGVRTSVL